MESPTSWENWGESLVKEMELPIGNCTPLRFSSSNILGKGADKSGGRKSSGPAACNRCAAMPKCAALPMNRLLPKLQDWISACDRLQYLQKRPISNTCIHAKHPWGYEM